MSPPEGGSPILVKAELTAGLLERGVSLGEAEAELEAIALPSSSAGSNHERNGGPEARLPLSDPRGALTQAVRRMRHTAVLQTASGSISSGRPLENFRRQMKLLQIACLTPSGTDEELRCGTYGMSAVKQ